MEGRRRLLARPLLVGIGAVAVVAVARRWRQRRRGADGAFVEGGTADDLTSAAGETSSAAEEFASGAANGVRRGFAGVLLAAAVLLVVLLGAAAVVVFHLDHVAYPRKTVATTGSPAAKVRTPLKVVGVAGPSSAPGGGGATSIAVEFSAPLVSNTPDPVLSPRVPGTWTLGGPSELVFEPREYLPPLAKLLLTVPAGRAGPRGGRGQTLNATYATTISVPAPSLLRLQQLLAELDYLPLRFAPATSPRLRPQLADAASLNWRPPVPSPSMGISLGAQAGSFVWRYPNVPASLAAQWRPGVETPLLTGAVMAFQSDHNLDDNSDLDAAFWADLFQAVALGQLDRAPYDYLEVSTTLPETLSVWRDGTVVYKSPCNTGIPEAPTAPGTYPVYARYLVTTMSGYNPDGSYYDDPGVPDVAYFNGGDAVHGFPRYSYGYPQSLGCVELPFAAAATVFPYDPIGTLVTVA
jgi:hypothetical protein